MFQPEVLCKKGNNFLNIVATNKFHLLKEIPEPCSVCDFSHEKIMELDYVT